VAGRWKGVNKSHFGLRCGGRYGNASFLLIHCPATPSTPKIKPQHFFDRWRRLTLIQAAVKNYFVVLLGGRMGDIDSKQSQYTKTTPRKGSCSFFFIYTFPKAMCIKIAVFAYIYIYFNMYIQFLKCFGVEMYKNG
jgi:hypothetical protein